LASASGTWNFRDCFDMEHHQICFTGSLATDTIVDRLLVCDFNPESTMNRPISRAEPRIF
jgi:hypothetical protein